MTTPQTPGEEEGFTRLLFLMCPSGYEWTPLGFSMRFQQPVYWNRRLVVKVHLKCYSTMWKVGGLKSDYEPNQFNSNMLFAKVK